MFVYISCLQLPAAGWQLEQKDIKDILVGTLSFCGLKWDHD